MSQGVFSMRTKIIRPETPEEQELSKKLSELAELETELAQCELDLATLRAELHTFEASYTRTVGARLAELDEIEAQIAEGEARLKPKDNRIKEQATQARVQAQESAEATGITQEPKKEKFKPSESLKKLYREVAKSIHPDLAVDEKERVRRQKSMADAKRAYEQGDEAQLRAILAEWQSSPESVKGEGTATELVRVIRKIDQIQKRLHAIETEIRELKESHLFELKTETEVAEEEGRDLLAEIASKLDADIALARKRLAKIVGRSTAI